MPGLRGELITAGISSELTRLLVGFEQGMWLTGVGVGLPVQVVHGDPAASNVLADEDTGAVTAMLDFEIAGAAADAWLAACGDALRARLRAHR